MPARAADPPDLAIDLGDVERAAARLRGVAHRTPVLTSSTLDDRVGGRVFLKAETFQRMGAFKFRGAYNAVSSLSPDELTLEVALDLARRQAEGPQALGDDPKSGLPVFVLNGRFGPYVQLGEMPEGKGEKPPRASLFKTMQPESVTLEQALELLSLPRVVGTGEDGQDTDRDG